MANAMQIRSREWDGSGMLKANPDSGISGLARQNDVLARVHNRRCGGTDGGAWAPDYHHAGDSEP